MLPLRLVTKQYDKERNFFTAILPSDEIVYFDPFVFCAIDLSDDDYYNGKGYDYEDKTYYLTNFDVQEFENRYMISPHGDGILAVQKLLKKQRGLKK